MQSVLIATNENNAFTINGTIECQNVDVSDTITCQNLDVSNINVNDLNVNNINMTGDIYVSLNQPYLPIGGVCIYSGQTAPNGWLLCDGSAISRTTYSRLFSVINTLYGSGNGTSTFNLPNLQERIPVGKTISTNLGTTGGNSSITLTTDQLPSHTHNGTTDSNGLHNHTGTTTTNGNHNHGSNATGGTGGTGLAFSNLNNTTTGLDYGTANELNLIDTAALNIYYNGNHYHDLNINNNGSHTHNFTTTPTGNGSTIDVRNKYIVMNYIIRY